MSITQDNHARKGQATSLCETCSYALIQRGFAESEIQGFCTRDTPALPLRFVVRTCTQYADRRLPSLYSMEKIAMILLQETAGRKMGFVTIEQFYRIEGEGAEVVPADRKPG